MREVSVDRYDVVWTTPGHRASDSMPLGNGRVGVNLWVEENGDVRLFAGRPPSAMHCCSRSRVD